MNKDLELWGGVECTLNRVRDRFHSQLSLSGHDQRIEDLDLFADWGIRTLRFPLLWEQVAAKDLSSIDWSWADARIERAKSRGIRLIAGLVHHGSGPAYTHLLDPAFPEKLAFYAQSCAERYPEIDAYTPINEPLTTARFSGLYGHWYPHGRDIRSFLRILYHECKGTILAMKAIRKINPRAELIQTEDLGRIFSTPLLAYQARYENRRRWLPFDLLCGRLNEHHPLWIHCLKHGLTRSELEWFLDNTCPPDIIGINHYVTSNRFLDERLDRYPKWSYGGNSRHHYADIEAVRVGAENIYGPRDILLEAWNQYRRPLAVTEVHMGCSRDEQLRWLAEYWTAAQGLRREGVDVRAITAWSLLGSFDWDTLVTKIRGRYEAGVFDLRAPSPRPTALASMVRGLVQDRFFDHPVLDEKGWWHRPERTLYPSVQLTPRPSISAPPLHLKPRELVITGAPGTLAMSLAYICKRRGLPFRLLSRKQLELCDPHAVYQVLAEIRPWAVINAAGYVRVDAAEKEPEQCFRDNLEGPLHLASYCAQHKIPFLSYSSDLVFNGQQREPYIESSQVAPLNAYGKSKAAAEREVLLRHDKSLIIRTSAFFGPWDHYNFLTHNLKQLAQGQRVQAAEDLMVSPTYVPELIHASLDLLIDGERGLWHLANDGAVNWVEFARMAAELCGLNPLHIEPARAVELGWVAPRPPYSVLSSERGNILPKLENAMERYIQECRVAIIS